jgi:hypothetical protein
MASAAFSLQISRGFGLVRRIRSSGRRIPSMLPTIDSAVPVPFRAAGTDDGLLSKLLISKPLTGLLLSCP